MARTKHMPRDERMVLSVICDLEAHKGSEWEGAAPCLHLPPPQPRAYTPIYIH